MNNAILQLTTDLAGLQKRYEDICQEKVQMLSKDEEESAEQNRKNKELASLVMALNNLELKFTEQQDSTFKYNHTNVGLVKDDKKDKDKGKEQKPARTGVEDKFEVNQQTLDRALAQLEVFKMYLQMYKKIVDGFDGKLAETRKNLKNIE